MSVAAHAEQLAGHIDVTDTNRGDQAHVDAVRDYVEQLRAQREATPVPQYRSSNGSEL